MLPIRLRGGWTQSCSCFQLSDSLFSGGRIPLGGEPKSVLVQKGSRPPAPNLSPQRFFISIRVELASPTCAGPLSASVSRGYKPIQTFKYRPDNSSLACRNGMHSLRRTLFVSFLAHQMISFSDARLRRLPPPPKQQTSLGNHIDSIREVVLLPTTSLLAS